MEARGYREHGSEEEQHPPEPPWTSRRRRIRFLRIAGGRVACWLRCFGRGFTSLTRLNFPQLRDVPAVGRRRFGVPAVLLPNVSHDAPPERRSVCCRHRAGFLASGRAFSSSAADPRERPAQVPRTGYDPRALASAPTPGPLPASGKGARSDGRSRAVASRSTRVFAAGPECARG